VAQSTKLEILSDELRQAVQRELAAFEKLENGSMRGNEKNGPRN